jgi:serine/threonine-protein kinase
MTPTTAADLTAVLRRLGLLEPAHADECDRLQRLHGEPRALARELIRRGWLTPYQANQLFQGRATELVFDSYVILERLGEGGMGAVFKARHGKLGRVVALKVLRKDWLESETMVRRFLREIQAASQLSHPNIVRALDAGKAGGTHFFAMEYVEGRDLARLVKEERGGRPLPIDEACDYVRQAALGLQHAHEKGLVHRDIKPANLLLSLVPGPSSLADNQGQGTRDKGQGTIKILDMGLARVRHLAESEESVTTLTREGSVMGTPDYMAPEQTLDSHDVDIRADLYSLGCTLYFLLAARVPFPGGSLGQKIAKHQMKEAAPVESLRPEVPPAVAAVVRRLMAKRPEDRHQTPGQLAAALEDMKSPRPVAVRAVPVAVPAAAETHAEWATAVASTGQTAAPPRRLLRLWPVAAGGVFLVLASALLLVLLLRGGPAAGTTAKTTQAAAATQREAAPSGEGWQPLFNGRDLGGWQVVGGRRDVWAIESGVLVAQGGGGGWLMSDRDFADFELRVEYRVSASANSGVAFRSAPDDANRIQIFDDSAFPDCEPQFLTAALYGVVGAKQGAARPAGVWNDMLVTARGRQLTIVLNGTEVLDVNLDRLTDAPAGLARRAGRVGLLSYTNRVEFRRVEVKPL